MDRIETQSIAQLTGVDWGQAPEGSSWTVQERHNFRQVPLQNLSFDGLSKMLDLDFQEDRNYLIPHSIARLDGTVNGNCGEKELLKSCKLILSVIRNHGYDWLQQPQLVQTVRQLVERTCYALYLNSGEAEQTSDTLEYYKVLLPNTQIEAAIYKALAQFEQRLSKVEPGPRDSQ